MRTFIKITSVFSVTIRTVGKAEKQMVSEGVRSEPLCVERTERKNHLLQTRNDSMTRLPHDGRRDGNRTDLTIVGYWRHSKHAVKADGRIGGLTARTAIRIGESGKCCPQHDRSGRRATSDDDHFKVFLACATFRTGPVHGHLFPRRTWCNAFVGQASGFVVDPAADEAHPGFEFCGICSVIGHGTRPFK